MPKSLLIANRGEIAVRIARTAAEMGVATVAVYAEDDAASLHTRQADQALAWRARGRRPISTAPRSSPSAQAAGCDAVHPGYGFLSENAAFARGLRRGGPDLRRPDAGDAGAVRRQGRGAGAGRSAAACRCCRGPPGRRPSRRRGPSWRAWATGGAVMLKAVAGGGGRGMRPVTAARPSWPGLRALRLGGQGRVRQRRPLRRAAPAPRPARRGADRRRRDRRGRPPVGPRVQPAAPAAEGGRDRAGVRRCRTALRAAAARGRPWRWARRLATRASAPSSSWSTAGPARPPVRLHRGQCAPAGGAHGHRGGDRPRPGAPAAADRRRRDAGGARARPRPTCRRPRGHGGAGAGEPGDHGGRRLGAAGRRRAVGAYEPPSGPGVRVDGFGYAGYRTSVRYDCLLAKLIVHAAGDLAAAAAKARRALSEFRIAGVRTNIAFLQALLRARPWPRASSTPASSRSTSATCWPPPQDRAATSSRPAPAPRRAGAQVDPIDPLALLGLKAGDASASRAGRCRPTGTNPAGARGHGGGGARRCRAR